SKSLRDMLVFANHNLVSDPPFLRLDLVSCRNVLIYLDKPLQGEALRRFHFSLKPNGTLFLGRSESVGQSESLFSTVNRRERIFSKQDTAESQSAPSNGARLAPLPRHRSDPPQLILSGLTSQLNITLALCAEDGKVIKTAGDTSRFFRLPSSSSEILLSNIIIPQLKAQMLTQLHSLRKTRRPQQSQGLSIFGRRWRMSSSYIDEHNSNRILLSISELGAGEAQASVSAPTAGEDIKDELQVTREQLQSVIEQLTTANEEMQMLNEEAQASNEELQATNEEMEASNEELQATSQELVTLNEELSVKSSELSLLNQEYAHLYDSFDFPVMVFDHDQRLLRFNAPASMQFQLRVNLSNLHLSELRLPAYLDDLDGYLEQVETQGTRSEFLVEHDHTAYQLMISPGFDEGGKSTFTVVSLVDISKMREAERELNESKNRLKTIMDNTT
ncbi:MAG: hypothetical protein OIF35_10740, partial [Cellvibrionaceae bacterium]|nr:hypothetical protein [Cellvibrionaceae bacterium]